MLHDSDWRCQHIDDLHVVGRIRQHHKLAPCVGQGPQGSKPRRPIGRFPERGWQLPKSLPEHAGECIGRVIANILVIAPRDLDHTVLKRCALILLQASRLRTRKSVKLSPSSMALPPIERRARRRSCGYRAASENMVHKIGAPASEPADRRRFLGQGEVNPSFQPKENVACPNDLDNPDYPDYICASGMEAAMVATVRKSGTGVQVNVSSAAVADILDVLARHNPGISRSALKGKSKMVAAVTAAAVRLSEENQRQILVHEKDLAQAMETVVADLAGRGDSKLVKLDIERPVEVSHGAELGNVVDLEEGRRRVAEYATAVRLEDWAGPVAGPSDIEKAFGTRRSTLHDWQKRGAVIGLLKGERKHVFPLAQFVDGRPVEGMSEVTSIIRNSRAAWQWLIQPKPSIGGAPLDLLKAGQVSEVVAAAERDFS